MRRILQAACALSSSGELDYYLEGKGGQSRAETRNISEEQNAGRTHDVQRDICVAEGVETAGAAEAGELPQTLEK